MKWSIFRETNGSQESMTTQFVSTERKDSISLGKKLYLKKTNKGAMLNIKNRTKMLTVI